jgi:hypothetical protein
VLGFDVFIDSALKPWVLEINDHPSLNIMLSLEGEKGLIKEPSEVDRYIKVTVIGDAIKLMRKRPDADYKCWHKILPDSSVAEIDCFLKAKTVYESLVTKLHLPMSLSAFSKLAKFDSLPKV